MSRGDSKLVLGLDPGIGSCGFCLLDLTNHTILEMGTRLFDTPQENKTKTSLAKQRRDARSARRNNRRTKDRMTQCLKLLAANNLVPKDADKQWLQSRKGDKPILKLRAQGLDRVLSDREFAQVLYSLCNRRGYIPHGGGLQGASDDKDEKRVLRAISDNEREMTSQHYRTVGEMLSHLGSSRNNGGDYSHCVSNRQIQDEVRKLFQAQRKLNNVKASDALEKKFLDCLVWEKEVEDYDERTYGLVGECTYFPEEKRAARADPSSELCRAYERLKHIVILRGGVSEAKLPSAEIERCLSVLFSPVPLANNKNNRVTYRTIRKDLGLTSNVDVFRGIEESREPDLEPFEPKAWRCLRQNLPQGLLVRLWEDDRSLGDRVSEALTYASSSSSLQNRLEETCPELSAEDIGALLNLPFASKVFKGYEARSLKALNILIGAFEDERINTLSDAERSTGLYEQRVGNKRTAGASLPPYNSYDPTCRNPVVLRAMGQMRSIVNAIIDAHGIPEEIHVELGRELKRSKREQIAITKRNNEAKAQRDDLRHEAAGHLGCSPEDVPDSLVEKLRLMEEQGCKDYYTGGCIDAERLLNDESSYQVDHILPYSRTCDNNRANKVLTSTTNNQRKGNRTPREWMTSGEEGAPDWESFVSFVEDKVENPRKRANLLNQNLAGREGDFIERNLNDTRYMSRAVRDYLQDSLAFPDDNRIHVMAVAGGVTAYLRRMWGLNYGADGDKDRHDERHHAVDAAVIAACSQGLVKAVAEMSARGRLQTKDGHKEKTPQPWDGFGKDVRNEREKVVPTRMVSHGATGRVYQDTLYHYEGQRERGGYSLLRHKATVTPEGNVRVFEDGSARIVDGMAFLRLWLNPNANPNGKVKGKWYAEPVYYADIPDIRAGRYVPKACKTHTARTCWGPVPQSDCLPNPIVLHRGDVLVIKDPRYGSHIGRFWSFDISNCRMEILLLPDARFSTGKGDKKWKTAEDFPYKPNGWGRDTEVVVLQQDCLGHCYEGITIAAGNSSFSGWPQAGGS